MRLAFLSDIHSNLPALEAVLDDIASTGVDARYVLGDLVGYAPWPNEVLERLQDERIPTVMGNYDEGTGFDADECGCAYTNPIEKALGDASFAWTKEHVSEANKAWLRTLQREIRFEADGLRVLLVHGSPRRINEYLYEDKPDSTFARIAADAKADLIVCGHTHRPYEKSVGRRLVRQRRVGGQAQGRRPASLLGTRRHGGPVGDHSGESTTTSSGPRRPSWPATCPTSSPTSCARRAATRLRPCRSS